MIAMSDRDDIVIQPNGAVAENQLTSQSARLKPISYKRGDPKQWLDAAHRKEQPRLRQQGQGRCQQ
jgi:hypothetical protein